MDWTGKHGLTGYNAGCRCDICKTTMSENRKSRRRQLAEQVGNAAPSVNGLRLLNNDNVTPLTSGNAPVPKQPAGGTVAAAVLTEIDSIGGHTRPGLAAAAVELARILDNPAATATKPAAAAKLNDLLDQLRKGATNKKSNLAKVRQMTVVKTG